MTCAICILHIFAPESKFGHLCVFILFFFCSALSSLFLLPVFAIRRKFHYLFILSSAQCFVTRKKKQIRMTPLFLPSRVRLHVMLHSDNMQLTAVLIPSRRRDFSMQTFVRPACALFFFTHCWSSDGCSNAPYAPAVQWPPPAKHWPICYGLTVQRPDTTAHCQSGTLTLPLHPDRGLLLSWICDVTKIAILNVIWKSTSPSFFFSSPLLSPGRVAASNTFCQSCPFL